MTVMMMMMMMTMMRSEARLPLTRQTWPTVRQGRLVGGQANHHRQLRCHQNCLNIVDDDFVVIILFLGLDVIFEQEQLVGGHALDCPTRATSGRII